MGKVYKDDAIFILSMCIMTGIFGLVVWACTMLYTAASCDVNQYFEAFGYGYRCSTGIMK